MEGGTKIRLHGENHQGTVFSILEKLMTAESLVDVTLAAEGQYIRAHKLILSACSPYFQDLLSLDSTKHPILFMSPEIKFNDLKALLNYVYKGETHIHQEDLPALLKLAETLKIRGLAETGEESSSGGYGDNDGQQQPASTVHSVGLTSNNGVRPPTSQTSTPSISVVQQQPSRMGVNREFDGLSRIDESQNSNRGVQLVQNPSAFLYNRVEQLMSGQSTSSSITPAASGSAGPKRKRDSQRIPSGNEQQNPFHSVSSSASSTSISVSVPQVGKRFCPDNYIEPLNFPTENQVIISSSIQEGQEQGPSGFGGFIDESSGDRVEIIENEIKIEDGSSEVITASQLVNVSGSPEENQLSSNQSWLLQDSSNQEDGLAGDDTGEIHLDPEGFGQRESRRRIFNWIEVERFDSAVSAHNFVKSQNAWKYHKRYRTKEGFTMSYDCKYSAKCGAKLTIKADTTTNTVKTN